MAKNKRKCASSRGAGFLPVGILLLVILMLIALDARLSVKKYVIDAEEIQEKVRIVFVSDLHSCRYGEGQKTLIDAVNDLDPDLVLLGGDIFDDVVPNDNTTLFLSAVSDLYPCYYVTGNHEYWGGDERFSEQMSILKSLDITILSGEGRTVCVNGQYLNITGIDDPDAFRTAERQENIALQLENASAASKNNCYTVLLAHRPEYFDRYLEYDFDLILSGHAHGGQWRIPLLLNGLYAPDQGLFPKYAGGKYTVSDTTMIVGRGLARESTRIPRIFNRPELVLIELN